ncbi:universal stress protein [Kitasatospora sp. GP82]|uniref:universal stress protein n=1 Tax=Kitasatospora sp. GP82 TaxID=3035089 RepID=UPI002473D273|nr:universal stress protein [Kitasatospora sp. GP82]MDH6124040.1 nucleotide-binding universal stress UspA family protein [Kitasatospora sp. GP82]
MTATSERCPIVLGVDALDPSPLATSWAADEAARRDLPLRLVHAVPAMIRDIRGLEQSRYHAELRRNGDRLLDEAVLLARERHPRLEVSTAVLDGSPGHALIRESAHAELVVLGSRRLSRAEEVLSAYSVAVPVSAQALCPVVVVHGPEHITQESPYLVVGVDGSASSTAAVDFAFDAAALRSADLRAIWVWQPPLIVPVDEQAALKEVRRMLYETTAGRSGSYPDVVLTHEVVSGHPVDELGKAADHALAVVVGRRGRGGFTGMRLGSVPHGLLHHAHCPVVVVPTSAHGRVLT